MHLHGFKCAGTTFTWILERNFPDQVRYVEHVDPGKRLPWQLIRDRVDLAGARAITSHLATLPPPDSGLAKLYVAFVREPVARLASAYRFAQQSATDESTPPETFHAFLRRIRTSVMSNYQTRHLSPQDDGGWEAREGWQPRPELIDLTRPDVFIGIVERFDESLVALERRASELGISFDGSYARQLNTTAGATAQTDWPAFADMVELDEVLHTRCSRWLSMDFAEATERMGDFHRRCREAGSVTTVRVKPEPEWIRLA